MSPRKSLEFHTVFDSDRLRRVYSQFPSGLAAVCALIEGRTVGFVVASFQVGISLDPPLVSLAVIRSSNTWQQLRRAPRLGVSVLSEQQGSIVGQLASKTGDRFAGIATERIPGGAVMIGGAAASFNVSIEHEYDAGDHIIAVLRVHGLDIEEHIRPLIFYASDFHALGATAR